MTYFVVRVTPRKEAAFLRHSAARLADQGVTVLFPRRRVDERRRGKTVAAEVALFPGYVFLRTEDGLEPEVYARVKGITEFRGFLRGDGVPSPVRGHDLDLLGHFLKFGEVAPLSRVVFDENQRIRVVSGPMEGLEGNIIQVDRRKRRAKIRLIFDRGTFTLTLGFELLQTAGALPGATVAP